MLFNDEGKEYLSDFLEAIRLTGQTMTAGDVIIDSLRSRLIVKYSDEMKGEVMRSHNLYSAPRLEQ